jgi:hypothetical protein
MINKGWIFIGALLVASLTGCVHSPSYSEIVGTTYGKTEDELVKAWGIPQGQYTRPDGVRLLQYDRTSVMQFPGSSVVDTWWCRTIFEVKEGQIQKATWQGDLCR